MAVNVSMHQGSNPWNFADQIGKSLDRAITVEFQKKKLSETKRQHWVDTKFKLLKMERDDLQNNFTNTMAIVNSIGEGETTKNSIINGMLNHPNFLGQQKQWDTNTKETQQFLLNQGYSQEQIDQYSTPNPMADLIREHTGANMLKVKNWKEGYEVYETEGGMNRFNAKPFDISEAYGMISHLQGLQNNSSVHKSVKDRYNIPSQIKKIQKDVGNYHFIEGFDNLISSLPENYQNQYLDDIKNKMHMKDANGQIITNVSDDSIVTQAVLALKNAAGIHKDDLDYQTQIKKMHTTMVTQHIPQMILIQKSLSAPDSDIIALGKYQEDLVNNVIPVIESNIRKLQPSGVLTPTTTVEEHKQIIDLQNQVNTLTNQNQNYDAVQKQLESTQARLDALLNNQSTTTTTPSDTSTTQPSSGVPGQFVTAPSGQNVADALAVGDVVGDITSASWKSPLPSALGLVGGEQLPPHRWKIMDIKTAGRDPSAQMMMVDENNVPILHKKTGNPYVKWVQGFEKSLYDNTTIFGNMNANGQFTPYKNSKYGSMPQPVQAQTVIPTVVPKTDITPIDSNDIDID